MKLSLDVLEKMGACAEAKEYYTKRPVADPKEAITLLIEGCDELKEVTERKRLEWGSWLIVRLLSRKYAVKYAAFAAEQVIGLYEEKYPDDDRPKKAIEAARSWLKGAGTADAADAADAAYAAYAAYAARAAAYAAYAAYAADAEYAKTLSAILKYGLTLLDKEAK